MALKSKWKKVLEEAPVDSQSDDIDWKLRSEAGSRRSQAEVDREAAPRVRPINPDFADDLEIKARGLQKHGDELHLFRTTKDHGINVVPGAVKEQKGNSGVER